MRKFPVLSPKLQVSFFHRLQTVRELCLHEALSAAVGTLNVADIDRQLSEFADTAALRKVASFGVRGEVFFPVPCLLETNPCLLGYYRLLLGFSQKEFYAKGPFGRFKQLEARGDIPPAISGLIPDLCASLNGSSAQLAESIDTVSLSLVHELQLLTLGPQLRGSENTRVGQDATRTVFALLRRIVRPYIVKESTRTLVIENESKRRVQIEFASDPDIAITEKLASGVRPLISIEIKGGGDASNIHNRLGEAEKSHQKARQRGFFEFWTIVRVPLTVETVKRESPTTSRLFHLDLIGRKSSPEYQTFREMLSSVLGIRVK
jgi:hypothetical protein